MKEVSFGSSATGSPNSDAWHAWRRNGIGGSDSIVIAAEAGLCPKVAWMDSIQKLWEVKTGLRSGRTESNWAMERGKRGEEPARQAYEKVRTPVSPIFGENDEHPFIRASFDGLSFKGDLIVEIKCPGEAAHALAKTGKVPPYYIPQLAHQGLVAWNKNWTGKKIHYASFVPETGDLAVVEANMAEVIAMAEQILPAEMRFWQQVMDRTAPCGDEWASAAAVWLEKNAALKEAEAELESAREFLVALLGAETSKSGGGVSVSRSVRKGSVDYKEMFKALSIDSAEAEKFRKPDTETISVRESKDEVVIATLPGNTRLYEAANDVPTKAYAW